MWVTKNNILTNASVVPTNGSSGSIQSPANVLDPDFSTFYQGARQDRLTLDFGATGLIDYVAVAGINTKGLEDFSSWCVIKDNSTDTTYHFYKRDHVIVIRFAEPRSFANLRVVLFNPDATAENPIIRYVAAGNLLEIPNSGEQAGYSRSYLERNWKNRVTLNNQAEPIAVVRTRQEKKGALSIPNATRQFCEFDWSDFIDYASLNPFFILERAAETSPSGSIPIGDRVTVPQGYMCYDATAKAKAHSQTRSLNSLSLNFKVYTGI